MRCRQPMDHHDDMRGRRAEPAVIGRAVRQLCITPVVIAPRGADGRAKPLAHEGCDGDKADNSDDEPSHGYCSLLAVSVPFAGAARNGFA